MIDTGRQIKMTNRSRRASIAEDLTSLFRDANWKHPVDTKLIEVFFSNRLGTDVKFKLSTHEELSETLSHIIAHSESDMFNRDMDFGVPTPIHVRMTIRDRHPETDKEYVHQAFVMCFRAPDEPSFVHWNETPDYGYNGPSLNDFTDILDRTNNDWRKMNFLAPQGKPELKLVHNAG